jgi:hypothetical protein
MLKQLALCAFSAFVSGVVIYFFTFLILGKKKANRLPGGALSCGIMTGFTMGTGMVVPAVILSVLAALAGHFVMVSRSKNF